MTTSIRTIRPLLWCGGIILLACFTEAFAADPGPRPRTGSEGGHLANMTANEIAFFNDGQVTFAEAENLADGIGPRFNLDSCGGCHIQPALGGTSPTTNPQVAVATAFGMRNTLPSFIASNGPVREARFRRTPTGTADGGVHSLFVITFRDDGSLSAGINNTCNIAQEDFATQVTNNNVSLRIPTPTFGLGLIESIPDTTILNNLTIGASSKQSLGIGGRVNINGNDGRIGRFGWKAQNPSLLVFSAEAYNVEMGISNEGFPIEREERAGCGFAHVPNDTTNFDGATGIDTVSDVEKFAFFMRFLAPPTPSATSPGGAVSIAAGRNTFISAGCQFCHTQTLSTGDAASPALRNQQVNLFSDVALHHMGPGLADGISQGVAGGDEFRTAPLWGLGQRIFFLHDGRTSDLTQAILAHRSNGNGTFPASEANAVINNFAALSATDQQNLLNYLRSL
ncbi:MAG: hypothetical protein QOI59_2957 [Gammaproteobacteria bacterium]|nr:hypothetical protein [Gammaproteobacteria bacterium]